LLICYLEGDVKKIVTAAVEEKAKAWNFEAKAKAIGPEANAVKI